MSYFLYFYIFIIRNKWNSRTSSRRIYRIVVQCGTNRFICIRIRDPFYLISGSLETWRRPIWSIGWFFCISERPSDFPEFHRARIHFVCHVAAVPTPPRRRSRLSIELLYDCDILDRRRAFSFSLSESFSARIGTPRLIRRCSQSADTRLRRRNNAPDTKGGWKRFRCRVSRYVIDFAPRS